jgi:hypothetical protein
MVKAIAKELIAGEGEWRLISFYHFLVLFNLDPQGTRIQNISMLFWLLSVISLILYFLVFVRFFYSTRVFFVISGGWSFIFGILFSRVYI